MKYQNPSYMFFINSVAKITNIFDTAKLFRNYFFTVILDVFHAPVLNHF